MTTISTEQTLAEAKAHFVTTYKRILSEKLHQEMQEEGNLDSVLTIDSNGWQFDGSFLGSVDEEAYNETMSEYAWRMGGDRDAIHESLQDPSVYDGVDYDAIIATAQGRVEYNPAAIRAALIAEQEALGNGPINLSIIDSMVA